MNRKFIVIFKHATLIDAVLNLVKLLTQRHGAFELINVQCAGVTTVIQLYQPRD